MASNRTPTRFYGPAQPSSTPGVLYTVPANKIAVIRCITLYAGGSDAIELGIGGTSAANLFHYEDLSAGPSIDRWKYVVATEAETINGGSGADSVTVIIDGDLYDE